MWHTGMERGSERKRRKRRKREPRGGRRASEGDEGRAWGSAGELRVDSTACTAASAVIGSHHSSAIFTMSPPIYPDCLCACHFSSERQRGWRERGREREREKERERPAKPCSRKISKSLADGRVSMLTKGCINMGQSGGRIDSVGLIRYSAWSGFLWV